ncbi:MAG: hypothetical protein ACQETZ_10380 [Candidatus Fermentibacterota bacterium]
MRITMGRAAAALLCAVFLAAGPAEAGRLFVGLSSSGVPTRSSDLAGFPDVTWTDHYTFEVEGAATTPGDTLYLCNGAFNTDLYRATLDGYPEFMTDLDEDIKSLAFGRDTLWGFSNYADTKGIYSIDTQTGQCVLKLDTYTGYNFRFFGLGYNPEDDMLYGYTEYGESGLYSIDLDTGDMEKIADPIPASNSQGRALAVGDDVVYLAATRGDDDIPLYAYDLSGGPGGEWEPFTNPYPSYHSSGGAAWLTDTLGVRGETTSPVAPGAMHLQVRPNPAGQEVVFSYRLPAEGPATLEVYDTAGRLRGLIMEGRMPAGSGEAGWSCGLPEGVYTAVLRSAETMASCRLVVLP